MSPSTQVHTGQLLTTYLTVIPACAGMTGALPLWIADQIRNDMVAVPGRVYSRLRGNDGDGNEGRGAGGQEGWTELRAVWWHCFCLIRDGMRCVWVCLFMDGFHSLRVFSTRLCCFRVCWGIRRLFCASMQACCRFPCSMGCLAFG